MVAGSGKRGGGTANSPKRQDGPAPPIQQHQRSVPCPSAERLWARRPLRPSPPSAVAAVPLCCCTSCYRRATSLRDSTEAGARPLGGDMEAAAHKLQLLAYTLAADFSRGMASASCCQCLSRLLPGLAYCGLAVSSPALAGTLVASASSPAGELGTCGGLVGRVPGLLPGCMQPVALQVFITAGPPRHIATAARPPSPSPPAPLLPPVPADPGPTTLQLHDPQSSAAGAALAGGKPLLASLLEGGAAALSAAWTDVQEMMGSRPDAAHLLCMPFGGSTSAAAGDSRSHAHAGGSSGVLLLGFVAAPSLDARWAWLSGRWLGAWCTQHPSRQPAAWSAASSTARPPPAAAPPRLQALDAAGGTGAVPA